MEIPGRLKARPLAPNASCKCKGKVLEENYKCYPSELTNEQKAKQPYADMEKKRKNRGLDRRSNQLQLSLKSKLNPEQCSKSLQFYEG